MLNKTLTHSYSTLQWHTFRLNQVHGLYTTNKGHDQALVTVYSLHLILCTSTVCSRYTLLSYTTMTFNNISPWPGLSLSCLSNSQPFFKIRFSCPFSVHFHPHSLSNRIHYLFLLTYTHSSRILSSHFSVLCICSHTKPYS